MNAVQRLEHENMAKKVNKRRRGKEEKRWERGKGGGREGKGWRGEGSERQGGGEVGEEETIQALFNLGIKMRRSKEKNVP